jgi:hypothetical protein
MQPVILLRYEDRRLEHHYERSMMLPIERCVNWIYLSLMV